MKLVIPSSLNDITLIQYQEYNQEIESRKKLPDAEEYLKIKKIEIFCKISREQIMNMEYDSVENISNILDNILERQPELGIIQKDHEIIQAGKKKGECKRDRYD